LIASIRTRLCSATALIDNQAAICAVANPRPQPAQHLVQLFHQTLRDLQRRRRTFKLHIAWIPGHNDVEGNEVVDAEAKGQHNSPAPSTPCTILPVSIAAMKASHKKRVARDW
ncbi:hypothetical protein B0H14DRAFT_2243001, partial [Mycena olivaceomarginata]